MPNVESCIADSLQFGDLLGCKVVLTVPCCTYNAFHKLCSKGLILWLLDGQDRLCTYVVVVQEMISYPSLIEVNILIDLPKKTDYV